MTEKRRTTITLPEEIYDEIDEIIEEYDEYTHRNEVVERAINFFHGSGEKLENLMPIYEPMMNSDIFLVGEREGSVIYLQNDSGTLKVKKKSLKTD